MTVDVSEATVVTLYLLAASNAKLRPLLPPELRPGSRIVAHNYPIGGLGAGGRRQLHGRGRNDEDAVSVDGRRQGALTGGC